MSRYRFLPLLFGLVTVFAFIRAGASVADPLHLTDVVYGHKLGVALTMDVFKPAKPNGIGVIWMVSGGWVSNHESIDPTIASIFTKRGMTVFEVVHGSQPRFTLPEIVQDIHRAVRFIRTHAKEYAVDPDRLAAAGGSAGGHLSMMIAAHGGPGNSDAKDPVDRASSAVQAAACFYPPTDFLNYGKEGANALEMPALKSYWHIFTVTEQTSHEERERIARSLSPIYGLSEKTPPTLVIHGDADMLVPLQQSERLISRLKDMKVPCKLIVKPGKGHGWPGIETDGEQLADWIQEKLSKEQAKQSRGEPLPRPALAAPNGAARRLSN